MKPMPSTLTNRVPPFVEKGGVYEQDDAMCYTQASTTPDFIHHKGQSVKTSMVIDAQDLKGLLRAYKKETGYDWSDFVITIGDSHFDVSLVNDRLAYLDKGDELLIYIIPTNPLSFNNRKLLLIRGGGWDYYLAPYFLTEHAENEYVLPCRNHNRVGAPEWCNTHDDSPLSGEQDGDERCE